MTNGTTGPADGVSCAPKAKPRPKPKARNRKAHDLPNGVVQGRQLDRETEKHSSSRDDQIALPMVDSGQSVSSNAYPTAHNDITTTHVASPEPEQQVSRYTPTYDIAVSDILDFLWTKR